MLRRTISTCLGAFCLVLASHASAGISLNATRIVFKSPNKEATITVRNTGKDVLVQSWIDSDKDLDAPPPFAVTPPLARVPANEQQLLRILYEGSGMPTDRESVLWLNVQEIPQTSEGQNVLQLAVRQRIKMFFRPEGLTAEAHLAPEELQWQLARHGGKTELKLRNPSKFHVSMGDVKLGTTVVIDSTMIAPGEERTFSVPDLPSAKTVDLTFSCINDYGAQVPYSVTLSVGSPAGATAKRSS